MVEVGYELVQENRICRCMYVRFVQFQSVVELVDSFRLKETFGNRSRKGRRV